MKKVKKESTILCLYLRSTLLGTWKLENINTNSLLAFEQLNLTVLSVSCKL